MLPGVMLVDANMVCLPMDVGSRPKLSQSVVAERSPIERQSPHAENIQLMSALAVRPCRIPRVCGVEQPRVLDGRGSQARLFRNAIE